MRSLIWKELRDGLKMAAAPIIVFPAAGRTPNTVVVRWFP